MSVRLFWSNSLFDALPAASLTPSSQSPTLPATNVQNSFRTRVWRTGNSQQIETLTIDFGVPVTVDACLLFYTTINEGPSTSGGYASGDFGDGPVTVAGNSADSWSSPPFIETLSQGEITDSQVPEQYFYSDFGVSPGSPTYRYWQIAFTKSQASQTRDIGRIFLGQTYDIQALPTVNGVGIELMDNSNKSKGVGLQTFVEVLPQFKQISLTFQPMAQADLANLDAILAAIGQNRSFWLQIDQVAPYTEIYYVKLAASHNKKLSVVSPTTTYWSVQLLFEEQL